MELYTLFLATLLQEVDSDFPQVLTDPEGRTLATEHILYEGQAVDYQYQRWVIHRDSVCQQQLAEASYPACRQSAAAIFKQTCASLAKQPTGGWRYTNVLTMYCRAAEKYRPGQGENSGQLQSGELEGGELDDVLISGQLESGKLGSGQLESSELDSGELEEDRQFARQACDAAIIALLSAEPGQAGSGAIERQQLACEEYQKSIKNNDI